MKAQLWTICHLWSPHTSAEHAPIKCKMPVSCPQQLTIYKTQNVLYKGDTDRHFTFTSESILTCKQVTSTAIIISGTFGLQNTHTKQHEDGREGRGGKGRGGEGEGEEMKGGEERGGEGRGGGALLTSRR